MAPLLHTAMMGKPVDNANESPVINWEADPAVLDACGLRLQDLLGSLLAHEGIHIHSIEHRVKSTSSTDRKIATKNDSSYTIRNMTDLLGLRVITHFHDEVDQVARLIESEFAVDRENSVDKRAALDPERFGYLSLHYVVQFSEQRRALREYAQFEAVRFEIQIRSILQHAWAEIEHDLGYKSKSAVPALTRRRFTRLAGLLELADAEFAAIRASLGQHAKKVTAAVANEELDVPIDRDSLLAYMRVSSLVESIENSAAAANGSSKEIVPAGTEMAGRCAVLLASAGVAKIEQLDSRLRVNMEVVTEYAKIMLRDDTEKRPRGIAVLYLGLLEVSKLPAEEMERALTETHLSGLYPGLIDTRRRAEREAIQLAKRKTKNSA